MNLLRKLATASLFVITISPSLFAQAKHTATLEEALGLKLLNSAKISPDGRLVVYSLRETNWKGNEFISQLWLVSVSSGNSFQLTRGKKSVGSAEWSPDGHWLAFTAEREFNAIEPPPPREKKEETKDSKKEASGGDGKPADKQIWLISPNGGEAWQLTKSETDVDDFHWSKDGKSILFTANPPETKSSKDRKEKYSDYDVIEKDYRQDQLWLVDVNAAAKDSLPVPARQVTTDASLNVMSFAWSHDGTLVAFSATHNPLLAFGVDEDIYLIDLAHNNAVSKIVALAGPDSAPMFSPDDKQLAFYTTFCAVLLLLCQRSHCFH